MDSTQRFQILVKCIVVLLVIFIFSQYKPLLLILVFEVLELVKIILKEKIGGIALDLVFVFGIASTYYYNIVFGFLIFFLGIWNRTFMKMIKPRHISKWIRHFFIFFLVVFLRHVSFFQVGLLMLILNYMMKYLFNIIIIEPEFFGKTVYHISNFLLCILMFFLINTAYLNLPFLLN